MSRSTHHPPRYPQKLAWVVFIAALSFAIYFLSLTAADLPPLIASHFDDIGRPNAFMTCGMYMRFMGCFAVGLPVGVVAIVAAVYANATDLKLPNRHYWLAP